MFQLHPLPAFQDNYIWMLQSPDAPGLAVAVDPGQSEPVKQWLKQNQLQLAAILITHHHPDHTGGVAELTAAQPDITVYGPAESPFQAITKPLNDGDRIEILGQRLNVKRVPAHTLDHIAYYTPFTGPRDQAQLFCGDTLFVAGCGRLFEGSAEQMHQAMQFFRGLPDSTQICCAHEYTLSNLNFAIAVEPNNPDIQSCIQRCQQLRDQSLPTLPGKLAEEKRINPFMRYDQPSVMAAAQQREPDCSNNEARVLATIRRWKDNF
ncbi:hydroxyacylglutathione hydrolase [Motiliproteus coralliicola]|uniref:Hydroxyacylglutathione hydrolase n=1 Tax=Motiliproteus coralliicola TaxID=2283196 RepID=A0A369WT01_9GAMM|nr:hydroxyacylglutathione hydrolase [Motiliproteus coralliicola]RDE24199.1 hydroxyacylglutathione hydrolase [Motiliproteus coralliicola]